jgi:response regulator RpfG family c-di-GMP phosphodiesterase
MRANPATKDIPAAALTAFARAEDRKRSLLAGFRTHVAEPVDPAELTAVVASLAFRTGKGDHHQGRQPLALTPFSFSSWTTTPTMHAC